MSAPEDRGELIMRWEAPTDYPLGEIMAGAFVPHEVHSDYRWDLEWSPVRNLWRLELRRRAALEETR